MNKELYRIAQVILDARKKYQKISDQEFYDFKSLSLSDAYQVQCYVIEGLSKEIIGWKLGGTNQKTREIFNVDKLYWGPVFKDDIYESIGNVIQIPDFVMCGEVECALQLANNITPENYKELLQKGGSLLIDNAAVSVEFPWSVFNNLADLGVNALVSDCCATGKALICDSMRYTDVLEIMVSVKMEVNDESGIEGGLKNLTTTPEEVLVEFIEQSMQEGNSLMKGQWVFTGGLTPCSKFEKESEIIVSSLGCNECFYRIH